MNAGRNRTKMSIQFPPTRIRKIIADTCKQKIGATASVYCAAVVEYIIAEILNLAGNSTTDKKRKVVSSHDLYMGINQDEELHKLVKNKLNIEILTGAVLPGIHSILL